MEAAAAAVGSVAEQEAAGGAMVGDVSVVKGPRTRSLQQGQWWISAQVVV